MSDKLAVSGTCLCGKVGIRAQSADLHVGACHCGMCRKWGGGPLLAIDGGTEVTIEGEEFVSRYSSSEWAERTFCKECGTHLFYYVKESGQHILTAGFLDQQDELVFDHQIFIDRKPQYYTFSNETKNMTEAEVFAQYSPQSE